ncbi:AraC family transcriptional regulator [Ketobacter alkanivorans]|nr:AraC family transcriptional regulator [Ketobacter alkanivorans]MCP5015331.1 AraC family transcriptional regulator [Ketobacter sp.]
MKTNTVSVHYVNACLERAKQAGLDIQPFITRLDVSPEILQDPTARIPSEEYVRLAIHLVMATNDEFLLLGGIPRTRPGTFALMAHATMPAGNLQRGILRCFQFYNLLVDDIHFKLSKRNDEAIISLRFDNPELDWDHQTADSVLVLLHRFFSWLIGQRLELTQVSLSGEPPVHRQEYQRLFRTRILFNQPLNALHFKQKHLDNPITQNESTLKEFLRDAPYNLVVIPDNDDSLTAKIRAIIGNDFRHEFPDFESVARSLNSTPQTLRRHLKHEGTSYQEIKDTMRRDAAIYYLNRSQLTINEIAELMGFSEPSTFHRAFKKWTGLTPGAYRQNSDQELL